jgi:hypothetical protein
MNIIMNETSNRKLEMNSEKIFFNRFTYFSWLGFGFGLGE